MRKYMIFCSGQAKGDIFGFCCGLCDGGLQTAPIRNGHLAHAEDIAADIFAIAVRRGKVDVSVARQSEWPRHCAEGNANVGSALQIAQDVDGVLELC